MYAQTNYASQMPYYPEMPQTYGAAGLISAAPDASKGAARILMPGQRRRINAVPIAVAIITPWVLFSVTFWVTSFNWHYSEPGLVNLVDGLGLLAVVASGIAAAGQLKQKAARDPRREPSWYVFLFIVNAIAWVSGMMVGDMNYYSNMRPFYDINNLNTYQDVDPSVLRGQMLMDAGKIVFAETAMLDISKSVGFRNQETYCVAPISIGNTSSSLRKLNSYDFWAVGTNCCSSKGKDFHCGEFKDKNAHGGLRLMRDDQRSFFRLAVQQAEAAYKIKAVHPLFFEWMQDPIARVNEYEEEGIKSFMLGIWCFLILQTFVVACAVLLFSKMGRS